MDMNSEDKKTPTFEMGVSPNYFLAVGVLVMISSIKP